MRRLRADSVVSTVKAMVDAAQAPLRPPKHVHLRRQDRPFWAAILRARARDEWTDNDLGVAAQLARCQADIEREQQALDGEDSVVLNERGTRVVNARIAVLEQLSRRQMALMRSLRIGGTAAGSVRDDAKRRIIQLRGERLRNELEDEELLAS